MCGGVSSPLCSPLMKAIRLALLLRWKSLTGRGFGDEKGKLCFAKVAPPTDPRAEWQSTFGDSYAFDPALRRLRQAAPHKFEASKPRTTRVA